jgi:hypothetical protein
MAALSANSVLVAGSVAGETSMANQSVKVVRPFWFHAKQHYVGAVVEVPANAAAELVAMGKAVKCDPPPKQAPRVETPKDEKK